MEVKTIIKGSQEPHSFELKAGDMQEIVKADLVIYNGANMESFISSIEEAVKDKNKFLNLSQGLTLLESGDGLEEEAEHEDGDKHEDEHGHGHNHKHGHDKTNPHTWLSVKNAIIQLDTIYKKVSSIDPENEAYYKENLKKAQDEFRALDKKFETELSKVKSKQKYFVVSHAAFNYLANDYGLKQVAVTGISPEDEPSAKQLQKIADFVIPLCATIHLAGSTITLTSCAMAILILHGQTANAGVMLPFIAILGVAMVAAPGIPGGAVMAALGFVQSILGFNDTMCSLIIALYIAQDSFGTACNVTGDGAIAILVDAISKDKSKE